LTWPARPLLKKKSLSLILSRIPIRRRQRRSFDMAPSLAARPKFLCLLDGATLKPSTSTRGSRRERRRTPLPSRSFAVSRHQRKVVVTVNGRQDAIPLFSRTAFSRTMIAGDWETLLNSCSYATGCPAVRRASWPPVSPSAMSAARVITFLGSTPVEVLRHELVCARQAQRRKCTALSWTVFHPDRRQHAVFGLSTAAVFSHCMLPSMFRI